MYHWPRALKLSELMRFRRHNRQRNEHIQWTIKTNVSKRRFVWNNTRCFAQYHVNPPRKISFVWFYVYTELWSSFWAIHDSRPRCYSCRVNWYTYFLSAFWSAFVLFWGSNKSYQFHFWESSFLYVLGIWLLCIKDKWSKHVIPQ